jgi:hypothetical protein
MIFSEIGVGYGIRRDFGNVSRGQDGLKEGNLFGVVEAVRRELDVESNIHVAIVVVTIRGHALPRDNLAAASLFRCPRLAVITVASSRNYFESASTSLRSCNRHSSSLTSIMWSVEIH